tara:strand:- start:160 stop:630 length:471 start_codon:yes stop_codon:yes gene_type:complete
MSSEDQEIVNHQGEESINEHRDNDSKTVNVGAGVRIEGRIEGAEISDISGTLSGTINSSNINISNTGNFNGDMSGNDITISGNVEGEINSDQYLIVNQSANIKGTIEYSSLQVSYGAKIQGTLRHRGSVRSYIPELNPIDQTDEDNNTNEDQEKEV